MPHLGWGLPDLGKFGRDGLLLGLPSREAKPRTAT